MARPELSGSVTGVSQFAMARRRPRQQEGAGLALLEEEEEGNLDAVIESFLNVEKQCRRLARDVANDQIVVLSKRRGQLK